MSRTDEFSKWGWPAALLAAALLTAISLASVSSYDTWWQLKSGLWMLEHGSILDREIWSFTQQGDPWTNFNWGFQILIAVAYTHGGDWGLFGLKAGLLAGLYLAAARLSIRRPLDLAAMLLVAAVLLPPIQQHLLLRPFLLEGIYMLSLLLLCREPLIWRRYILINLLLLVWANSHASGIVGAAAFGSYLLLDQRAGGLLPNWRHRITFALLPVVIPFCTPFGLDMLQVLVSHETSPMAPFYIEEWLPLEHYPWILLLGLGVYFGSLLINKAQLNVAELFLILFFAYFSSRSARFEFELALLLFRPLTTSASLALGKMRSAGATAPILFSALFLVGTAYISKVEWQDHLPNRFRALTTPVLKANLPLATTKFLNAVAEKMPGRPIHVANQYGFGGYLAYSARDSIKYFIDGRTPTIFNDATLLTITMIMEGNRSVLDTAEKRFGLDALLLSRGTKRLIYPPGDKQWQLVAFDAASVLYIRRSLATELGLSEISFDPTILNTQLPEPEHSASIEALKHLLAIEPDNALAWLHLGILQSNDSSVAAETALTSLQTALSLQPGDPTISLHLTWRMLKLDSSKEDIRAVLSAIHMDRKTRRNKSLIMDLAKIALDVERPDFALLLLYPDHSVTRQRLNASLDAWLIRGLAHISLGQFDQAEYVISLARTFMGDADQEQTAWFERLQKNVSWARLDD